MSDCLVSVQNKGGYFKYAGINLNSLDLKANAREMASYTFALWELSLHFSMLLALEAQ